MLPLLWVYYNMVRGKQEIVVETRGVQEVAQKFEACFRYTPLVYADAPLGLQFYLNTMRQRVSLQEAAERLTGEKYVLVAV